MDKRQISILVAEDEDNARLLYFDELSDEGYRVYPAMNGLQALGLLEDNKIDLVVTDIKMPDMHALEMIPWIRAEYPGLPVIVVSAFKGMENDFNLKENFIDGFFAKPVNMEALKRKIEEILTSRLAHHAA